MTATSINSKQRIRESFHRAAVTYDGAAELQRRVCHRLLEHLQSAAKGSPPPRHILDAGCGTGYGTRLLHEYWPMAHITGADFAPAMLTFARRETDANLAADIESLPFADNSFDLWWSSLVIQWCHAATVFREAARVLSPGGKIAFSTLNTHTFHELRSAFSAVDPHRHTLSFSEPDTLIRMLKDAGFGQITVLRKTHTVHYPDLKTLLRAVKAIGASTVGEGARSGMMGKTAWKRLEENYENHRSPAGLPASYDVLLGYAIHE